MNRLALAITILTTILLPAVCAAGDNVVISQVLYDPLGTETGGEAVELYNPTAGPIDISGYVLSTESSATDATVPDGTVLPAYTFYLLADTGWSTLRDIMSWPEADHEEAITMSNTDAGVALTHPNGTILDAVGWGNPSGIGAGLYEGTPSSIVAAGNSLKRTDISSDTDDNSADFSESAPEPKNSSMTSGAENPSQSITIGVEVENNPPTADSIIVLGDEDSSAAGIQISPVPEDTKTVTISAEVTDLDGTEPSVVATITGPASQWTTTLVKTHDINSTTAEYNTTLELQFYDAAGTYQVVLTADDSSANSTINTTFEYLSMTAISIDASALQFIGAKIGSTTQIDGDFALATADAPTVKNIGNTQIDLGLYGTDLVDGTKRIGIENIRYSFDDDFISDLAGTLAATLQTKSLGMPNSADSVISLGFQLSIPTTTQNGNYTGSVTVVAMSS